MLNRRRLLDGLWTDKARKLKIQGFIPLKEAEGSGKFVKLGWDTYKKIDDSVGESIWTVSDIEGEKWLVIHTDDSDQIIRGLIAETLNQNKMQKTAVKAAETRIGDLASITPANVQSINRKYTGQTGEVVASYPERSKLQFDDGYTLWVENKDLQVVKRGKILAIDNEVRLKRAHGVKGKVTEITNESVTFKSATGQTFTVRPPEIEKLTKSGDAIFMSMPDAYAPKIMRELTKMYVSPEGEVSTGPPTGEEAIPPAIKAEPTKEETSRGTAMPAGETASFKELAAKMLDEAVYGKVLGRVMNLNDPVMNKDTGQTGTIQDIRVDRKWGKFYLINYGGNNVVREFETNLMKIPQGKAEAPQPTTPGALPTVVEKETPPIPSPRTPAESKLPTTVPTMSKKNTNIQKIADPVMDRLRGPGGPGTSGGGGIAPPSTVKPLTWEVQNEGTEEEKKDMNLFNDALDETMDEEAIDDNKVVITLDPTTKKITLDFGDAEEEQKEEQEMLRETVTAPPGSPLQLNPEKRETDTGSPFSQEQIGVNF